MSPTENQPLSTFEQTKILIFFIFLIPLIMLWGIGLLFIGLFIILIFHARRQKSTSTLEAGIICFKVTALVFLSAWWILYLHRGFTSYFRYHYYDSLLEMALSSMGSGDFRHMITFSIISLAYYFGASFLFLSPVRLHRMWISKNGIFSSNENHTNTDDNTLNYLKKSSHSTADELIKLAQLRNQGDISEEQYQNAIRKTLDGSEH